MKPPRASPVYACPRFTAARRTGVVGRLLIAACMLTAAACGGPAAAPPAPSLSIGQLLAGDDTLHARALEPRQFRFPRDHGAHPEFRTEWWYFTGNLTADDGRELGYQLTFFRSALADSASFARDSSVIASPWRARHAWMAHLAVTDAGAGAFQAAEQFARESVGLAGAESAPLRVWLNDWSAVSLSDSTFPLRLRASAGDIAVDLTLERGKPIVLQGERGLSRKGAEPGNASFYYSLTRLPTSGTIRTAAGTWTATGASWLDREWSTSVLSDGVTGWDWLSLQLSDSTELMLYRLRRSDGSVDAYSAGTFIAADGSTRSLAAGDFTMSPLRTWSAADGVTYPVSWRIVVPVLDLELSVTAPVRDQELRLAVRYWEGMVRAEGERAGARVDGRGYLEMTGYAGADDVRR